MTQAEFELTAYAVNDGCTDQSEDLRYRLAHGDLAAVAEAYDAFHVAVRALAQRLIGDPGSVEDLVQEVFVSLPDAMRRYRGDASLKTFLLSIAVNLSRHYVRSSVRRRSALGRLGSLPTTSPTDPEQLAWRQELAQILLSAMDRLPYEQRVAFVLSDVENRPSPEVATIVNAPEATVRTRLFHARRKLRETLAEKGVLP